MDCKWTVGGPSDSEANFEKTETELTLRGRMLKRRGVDKGTALLRQNNANDSTECGLF